MRAHDGDMFDDEEDPMPLPTALAEWRAANERAIDCRSLVHQGDRLQCPGCLKWFGALLAVERVGLRCPNCAKRALGRFVL